MTQFDEHIFQMGWNHELVFHGIFQEVGGEKNNESTSMFLFAVQD